ncbi:MAG: Si-specific NAD(P)(+) transhydrogenase [Nitrospirota bacterium]|nr:Si-specific NAD(P)(+) transhydrogenase [Nitrospirota bacterium]MDP2383720.1 Si-specific NAD(P)(+) transhydrogenase [Nitrospirota bacterium]MDP3598322.1 Si-specific NAD(P)(+) transhydrogenase [Nitrospirota bacterium]
MSTPTHFDIVVIGSGPAGQKAAIQGAKAGKRVAVIEREPGVGGGCVYRGTIPSKTLRESALQLDRSKRSSTTLDVRVPPNILVSSLMRRVDEVVTAHGDYMEKQLTRNGILFFHGRVRFCSATLLEMLSVDGVKQLFTADTIVIATGSRPRAPVEIPIDHEHILDSDSILSMIYLPRSLTVLGGGVVASEYASIFAALGVQVTIIDRANRPLQFLDAELVKMFVQSFEQQGGRYCAGQAIKSVLWDGISQVVTTLQDGQVITSDKMLVAMGRQPNLEDLNLSATGLPLTEKGTLAVNEHCQTALPHIYGVGDLLGPPGLASTAMEQGRRAVCHALGLPEGRSSDIPVGIYTIPEMASIGLDEAAARARYREVLVGRSRFDEIARGQISGLSNGLMKLVADPTGVYLLGVQIIGEGATELIHVGQIALQHGATIDSFVENIFNFPTLAEGYRIAALDIAGQRQKRLASQAA